MSEINKKVLEKIQKWSKKTGLKEEELINRFKGFLSKEKDPTRALKLLRNELSEEFGSMASTATPFYVYLIGDSGMFDWVERMKAKVARMIEQGRRDEAIQKQYMTPEGQILDWRAKKFGRDNPNKGLPLEGFEFERDLLGLVSSDPNFERVDLAEIVATGKRAENLKEIELFNFYRFRGNVGKKPRGSNYIRIFPGTGCRFNKYVTDITPAELVNKIEYFELGEGVLKDLYNNFYKTKGSNYLVAIKGEVSRINFEPRENSRRKYRSYIMVPEDLDLFEESLYCQLDINIPIKFRELDPVVSIGRLWTSNRGGYGLETRGYIPLI